MRAWAARCLVLWRCALSLRLCALYACTHVSSCCIPQGDTYPLSRDSSARDSSAHDSSARDSSCDPTTGAAPQVKLHHKVGSPLLRKTFKLLPLEHIDSVILMADKDSEALEQVCARGRAHGARPFSDSAAVLAGSQHGVGRVRTRRWDGAQWRFGRSEPSATYQRHHAPTAMPGRRTPTTSRP